MNPQDVNKKAIDMLINAADGTGESRGFIDEYRYRAGDTQMADYEELTPQQEFQAALNLLINKGWAIRLPPPAHHQAQKGAVLTSLGFKVAREAPRRQSDHVR